jgi:XTP/dITP diphosphohydrolase
MKAVLASSNPGKLAELRTLLVPDGFDLVGQDDLGIDPAPEDGLTFIENALAKARHACASSGLPAIADDSGIVVDALDGAPGIYSARFAGSPSDDAANNRKLLSELCDQPNRQAHYYCAIVFLRHVHDPAPIVATGRWFGEIVDEPAGKGGFGYDPYFFVPELQRTAAELAPAEKNRISHRGKAVARFLESLRTES